MDVVRTTDSGRAAAHTMLAGPAAREVSARHPRRVFFGLCALLCVVSAVLTVVVCMPMSAGSGMPMPGGWSMSMAWSRMSGQSWPHVAASFTGMWALMMVAMMMPSITPILWRCHESLSRPGSARAGLLTVCVGVGYFLAWTLLGVAVFPAGAALAALEMHWPALSRVVPGAAGAVILAAGIVQFSAWKARHLAYCCGRSTPKTGGTSCVASAGAWVPASVAAATRYGMRQGLHCVYSC
ncbi:copper chaperone, partial [Paraburkholderia humisilvae]